MRGGIGVRGAQLAIVALCAAAAVLIFLIALDTTPIADDYGDLPSIMHAGVFQYLHSYWVGLTDRYSNAVFMVVLVKLFGATAIHIATPLLIALLVCFCVAIARRISTGPDRGYGAVMVGCLASITIAVSTPSIFDTLGWFNAVSIYLAGVVAAVGTAAWMTLLATRPTPVTTRHTVTSFLVGFLAAGFTELIGVVIALAALLAVASLRDVSPRGPRRRALELTYLAVAAGAIVGVMVILLGPGSQARTQLQHGGFDLSLIATAARVNVRWANTNLGWRTLVSIAAGLGFLSLRGAPRSQSSVRWLLVWAVFLWCVPMAVVGVAAGYSGTTTAALRTASVETASIAVGEAIVAYVVAAALMGAAPRTAVLSLAGVAAGMTVGLIGFGTAAIPVIRAERLRRTAVNARAASIRRQLQEHPRSVSVMPAPLIDAHEGAYDFFFGHTRQFDNVLEGIRVYYGIPAAATIHVIERQPRSYCLPHVSVQAFGVRSCADLALQRRRGAAHELAHSG